MPIGLLIGIGSGLVSALLFYSATRGSPLLSSTLLILTPLPTLIAGLGWGWTAALLGGIAASVVMAIVMSLPFAAGHFLALGAPSALAAYLAYLSRPDPNDPSRLEWYPAGRLLAGLSLYGGALPVAVLPLIGGTYEGLREPLGEHFRQFSEKTAADFGLPPLTDAQVENLTSLLIAILPAALAAYWLMIFVLDLYLAARVARASGRLDRDWPDLPALAFPTAFPLLTAAALFASFMPGALGVAGTSFGGAMLIAYLLAGLALVHFIARARAPWILWPLYAGLLILPYVAIALIIAGLLEPLLGLKRRFGSAPPST